MNYIIRSSLSIWNCVGSKKVSEDAYTYDAWGNVTSIKNINGYERTYTYNNFSEVTQASETYADGTTTTYAYSYDNGGNILTETIGDTVHTYTYDEVWKDKLISYDGKSITYDVFGCPVEYMGSAMTWDVNGSLTSIQNEKNTISYTYLAEGQRRSKTVNGKTTTYHYNNGMLLSETTDDETIRYYYDSTGKVASIAYKKGEQEEKGYFFARNVQGDITAIYRSSDSKLIGTYEYDLWGKLISIREAEEGTDTDDILTKNPIRYRGYYYDNETGFYHLTARYYDPAIRRFINADSTNLLLVATTSLSCKNLFNYSENNPVMNKDSSGAIVESGFDIVTLGFSVVDVCVNPTDPWAGLVGDVIDLIPCVTGVGEGIKGLRAISKMADTAGDATEAVIDASKAAKNTGSLKMNLQFFGEKGSKITVPDKAKDIAQQIKANDGVALKGYKGGRTYKNIPLEEGAQKLPEGVNYKEYDINPYIKGQNRGAERIVIGDDGSVWYTNNHYYTFSQIK